MEGPQAERPSLEEGDLAGGPDSPWWAQISGKSTEISWSWVLVQFSETDFPALTYIFYFLDRLFTNLSYQSFLTLWYLVNKKE